MGRCARPRSQRGDLDRRSAATSGANGIRHGAGTTRHASRHTKSDPECDVVGTSHRRESPGARGTTGFTRGTRSEACARRSNERIESGRDARRRCPGRRRHSRDCDRGLEAIADTRTNAFSVGEHSGVFAGRGATCSRG